MRVERILWTTLTIIISALLAFNYYQFAYMKQAFFVQKNKKYYQVAATKLFIKNEGATQNVIRNSFYVAYLGFSDRSCVRFVPKPQVYGGATTYCFTKEYPIRLIGVDREAE